MKKIYEIIADMTNRMKTYQKKLKQDLTFISTGKSIRSIKFITAKIREIIEKGSINFALKRKNFFLKKDLTRNMADIGSR